eukprot:1159975-Pelagomonas_calceolata.AAC.2
MDCGVCGVCGVGVEKEAEVVLVHARAAAAPAALRGARAWQSRRFYKVATKTEYAILCLLLAIGTSLMKDVSFILRPSK